MSYITPPTLRFLTACTTLLLCACSGLPSSGPSNKSIINNIQTQNNSANTLPPVTLIDVDTQITHQLQQTKLPQSFADLDRGHFNKSGVVGVGDVLSISIWEASPALLFGGSLQSGAHNFKLPEQIVGTDGRISIPYAGSLNVRGKTPEQIQQEIAAALSRKANRPQAIVQIIQNNSANATIIRSGNSIRIPLTSARERILDAIAAAGGTDGDIQDISVQLTRNGLARTIALETLSNDGSQNITLQPNDVITLLNKPLTFTALGAVGQNRRIRFSAKGMNLGEAVGEMGGLIDRRADPKGVFVFRYQTVSSLDTAEQTQWQQRGFYHNSNVPVLYRFDLNNPQSMFWLQNFAMQDKDIIYVANAPLAEVQKFLQFIFSPVVNGANSINNLGN